MANTISTITTATTQAEKAAQVAINAADTAKTAASQAAILANKAVNLTTYEVFNQSSGSAGEIQYASVGRQFSSSGNLYFNPDESNLTVKGNLVSTSVYANSIYATLGNITTIKADSISVGAIDIMANLTVANNVTGRQVSANLFVGDGSQLSGVALSKSPVFTGNVKVPIIDSTAHDYEPVPLVLLQSELSTKANLDSPSFTGTPTAPTSYNVNQNDSSIATTGFVQLVAATKANLNLNNLTLTDITLTGNVIAPDLLPTNGFSGIATANYVQAQKVDTIFSGVPQAPTPDVNASNFQIATVGYVKNTVAPAVVLSRRTNDSVSFAQNVWQNIPFDTFERNVVGCSISNDTFTLPAGNYVYNISIPVVCDDNSTNNTFYTRFVDVDTSYSLQNISYVKIGGMVTTTITGTGQINLNGTKTIALQGFLVENVSASIYASAGFQSGFIEFYKVS